MRNARCTQLCATLIIKQKKMVREAPRNMYSTKYAETSKTCLVHTMFSILCNVSFFKEMKKHDLLLFLYNITIQYTISMYVYMYDFFLHYKNFFDF